MGPAPVQDYWMALELELELEQAAAKELAPVPAMAEVLAYMPKQTGQEPQTEVVGPQSCHMIQQSSTQS
jgi:hypothetical protein